LQADTKSIVQAHTVYTMHDDKNQQNRFQNGVGGTGGLQTRFNRTFHNGVGGRTTGLETLS